MGNKIIVALDGISEERALKIAKELRGLVWGFKVNDLLFENGAIIKKLKKFGKVFADAKLHDIPNTVANSVVKLSKAGADIITIHASGGTEMMKAAKSGSGKSKIIAITVLTSSKKADNFLKLVKDAEKASIDGVVCSAHELKYIKKPLIKIVPGIRPDWYNSKDDQNRTSTPQEAINWGADFIVIGRPILNSSNPRKAVLRILEELLPGDTMERRKRRF